jgi:DNA-binding response OmpR family regulator
MSMQPMTILVVDDEPLITELYQYMLETAGFRVLTATQATEAFRFLDTEVVDALICDLHMYPVDGQTIAHRARRSNPNLPILFVTGSPEPEDRFVADQITARLLLKPVPVQILIDEVETLTQRSFRVFRGFADAAHLPKAA